MAVRSRRSLCWKRARDERRFGGRRKNGGHHCASVGAVLSAVSHATSSNSVRRFVLTGETHVITSTTRPKRNAGFWDNYADETMLAAGCLLVVVALWPTIGALTLVVPGGVLLWASLPTRKPFTVERSDVPQRLRPERIDK